MSQLNKDESRRRAIELDDRLKVLFREDALSNAYLRYYIQGEISLEEALIGLVVQQNENLRIMSKKYLHELQLKAPLES